MDNTLNRYFVSEIFEMQTNITRSKILINAVPDLQIKKKKDNTQRCKHCGGTFKVSVDITACIMCSRESGHTCSTCINGLEES